jgi:hypothetical protein
LEPHLDTEKVDIIWHYADLTETKVTQVKSSQNQFRKAQVEQLAKDLEASIQAKRYELILIGPSEQAVINLSRIGNVEIPTPRPLDINGLIEQVAHRLDIYGENRGLPKSKAIVREILAKALITQLETYSTSGTPISRDAFKNQLDSWITAGREKAVKLSSEPLLKLKGRIKNLIGELQQVKNLYLDHPDDKEWRTTARRYLSELDKTLLGSDYARQYDLIPWHPPNKPAEDTKEQRAIYSRACDNVEGLLKGAIRELDENLEEIRVKPT